MKLCVDCEKQIKNVSTRCKSCSHKGKLNPRYGNSHSPETRKKLSEKAIIRLAIPENNPNYKGENKKKKYCLDCNILLKSHRSERCLVCANKTRWKDAKYKQTVSKKIRESVPRGTNHHCWDGGKTSLQVKIRTLPEYSKWRLSCFERDGFKCCSCKNTGYLEVHHMRQFSILLTEFLNHYSQFSSIEDKETLVRLAMTYIPFWAIDNGKTLCEDCHSKIEVVRTN